jgi:hypothetical protein
MRNNRMAMRHWIMGIGLFFGIIIVPSVFASTHDECVAFTKNRLDRDVATYPVSINGIETYNLAVKKRCLTMWAEANCKISPTPPNWTTVDNVVSMHVFADECIGIGVNYTTVFNVLDESRIIYQHNCGKEWALAQKNNTRDSTKAKILHQSSGSRVCGNTPASEPVAKVKSKTRSGKQSS